MTQRDYVARGRTAKKKRAVPKSSASSPTPISPPAVISRWRVAIVVLLLVGFAAFLWSIKDNAPPVDAPVRLSKPAAEEVIPEIPEEEWEYIKTLPGYEVEVDVAVQKPSDKRYLMQCASFRTRAQAEELKAKIALHGFESQIKQSRGDSGEWFRVIMGPFNSKRDAEKTKHALAKLNVNGCQIWFWNL